MRAVSLILALSLLGCFPHNRGARRISQLTEGGLIVSGIVLESFVKTGADCDQMLGGSTSSASCHSRNAVFGGVGVALILGGLLGFVATISTAKDDNEPPKVEIKSEAPKAVGDKPKLSVPIAPPPAPPAPAAAKPAESADVKPVDANGTH